MVALLRKALFLLASLGLAVMVGSLFLQVLAREFRWPVDWTEEMGRFSFITMVFIAAAYGTLTRSHLRVTVFSDLLARVVGARAIAFVHTIVLMGFAGVMVVFSWLNFVDGIRYPNISPAMGFNQNYLFISMCGGFAIILLLHLCDLIVLLRGGQLDE
ncbi:MAG: TRAP transporter small permease subunit [Rhodobacteraceae bacterium]|nr:TRAP transporter small permease subunit [Paracoccaceae bacterium]